jgi:LPXTG-motif cell wall-anchored protein
MEKARSGGQDTGVPLGVYLGLVVAALAGLVFVGRTRNGSAAGTQTAS